VRCQALPTAEKLSSLKGPALALNIALERPRITSFTCRLFTFGLTGCPACISPMLGRWATYSAGVVTNLSMTKTVQPKQAHDVQAALQYLTWALEEIKKVGNEKAARHAQDALDALRQGKQPADWK
jgi:hypothetical protein